MSSRLALGSALALTVALAPTTRAVTITTTPAFLPSYAAPLAGLLQLTTDVPSRVSVSVNDGTNTWQRDFYDYATFHEEPLYGFKPGRTNSITVTVWDQFRNAATAREPVIFVTDPLPYGFPVFNVQVSQPARMEPGYTLFRVVDNSALVSYVTLMDNAGEVVWYSSDAQVPTTLDVRQLADGNLFIPLVTNFTEVDLLGNQIQSWLVPNNLNIDSHDGVPTDHGSILYINDSSATVPGFPTSVTISNAPTETAIVEGNAIIEMSSANGALLNNWSLLDLLDPVRVSYLTFTTTNNLGIDWGHANAVIEDTRDNTIIASLRHQNAVVKFTRDTGQLVWILGPPENWGPEWQPYLLTPVGSPFEWNYGQHAPRITPQGTLLLYR